MMARKTQNEKTKRVKGTSDISRIAAYAGMAIFAVLAYVSLIGYYFNYLKKVEELSLFIPDLQYFKDCMTIPGGFLLWAGSFMTQFFFYPWLGATIMITMLLGLWWLVSYVCKLPKSFFTAAAIPSVMLLLAFLTPGYLIFVCKTPGFAYVGILGVTVSMLIYHIYTIIRYRILKICAVIVVAVTYPLFGFYSLFGLLLISLHEIKNKQKNWIVIVLGVLCIIAVPGLTYHIAGIHLMYSQLYTSGLPRFGIESTALTAPYIICFSLLCLFTLFGRWLSKHQSSIRTQAIVSSIAFVLSMLSLVLYQYKDDNFTTYLKMDQAIDNGDFESAIDAARNLNEPPTRTICLYTHMALFHLNKAGDSVYSFPIADTEYNSPLPNLALRTTCSRNLLYRLGRINDCYRWSMEDMVEYGPKVEYLKYLAKCALMNGEPKLAKRYLNLLSKTMFHKNWADKYLDYANHPEKIEQDLEFVSIKPLMAYNNHIGGDGGLIESYLSTTLASMAGGPPPLVELSLQFNMMRKDITNFWPRFILYANSHEKIPRHYQEAAILFSTLERQFDWHQFDIDDDVVSKFERFMEMAGRNARLSNEANLEYFKPEFGDTYWYYYFFINNLRTS